MQAWSGLIIISCRYIDVMQTVRGRIERRIVKAEEQLKIRFDRAVAAVQKSWARGG